MCHTNWVFLHCFFRLCCEPPTLTAVPATILNFKSFLNKEPSLECDQCPYIARRRQALDAHVKIEHGSEESDIQQITVLSAIYFFIMKTVKCFTGSDLI
jgi:hypothetical protein